MTGEEIETEARALSIGWDPANGGIIHEDAPTIYCNAVACDSWARLGTDAPGATGASVALALRALLDGDRGPLDAMMAAAAVARGG